MIGSNSKNTKHKITKLPKCKLYTNNIIVAAPSVIVLFALKLTGDAHKCLHPCLRNWFGKCSAKKIRGNRSIISNVKYSIDKKNPIKKRNAN